MEVSAKELDSPFRYDEIRSTIEAKPALRRFYQSAYERFADCLSRCPKAGFALELGSGGGFLQSVVPEVVTSDFIAYPGVDRQIDATRMQLSDRSLKAILLLNVFHHIPDVEAFLSEANRCLVPGGRLFLVDQYPGWPARFIYRHLHHEPFDPDTPSWRFETSGPLSGANGALAWIVFVRDRAKFEARFPGLKVVSFRTHTFLFYWLAGGLKWWSLIPRWACSLVESLDRAIVSRFPRLGSFVDIEIVKEASVD